MTTTEIKDALHELAEQCDDSKEQQAIKGVLLLLQGAIIMNSQARLFNHACAFAEQQVAEIATIRAMEQASRN